MKDTDIIKAVAECRGFSFIKWCENGWCEALSPTGSKFTWWHPAEFDKFCRRAGIGDVLNSRDAIVPVIEKHWYSLTNKGEPTLASEGFLVRFGEECEKLCQDKDASFTFSITPYYRLVMMKAKTICEALLRAKGKWVE